MVGPLFAVTTATLSQRGSRNSPVDTCTQAQSDYRTTDDDETTKPRREQTGGDGSSSLNEENRSRIIDHSGDRSGHAAQPTAPSPNPSGSSGPSGSRSPRLPLRRPSLPIRVGRPLPSLSLPSLTLSPSGLADWPWGGIDSLRHEARGAPGSTAQLGSDDHRELLVIVHGLQGQAEDFNFVLETLKTSHPCENNQLYVHASRINTDRTHDGVSAGGKRLASDIRSVVSSHQLAGRPFRRLSLIGFSLGGLYVRFAAAELFEPKTKTLCGLFPGSMILVASPHLGVRRFGVYRFVPEAVRGVRVFGDTVREMMLMDDEGILERMSRDDEYEEFVYENENRSGDNIMTGNGDNAPKNGAGTTDLCLDSDEDLESPTFNSMANRRRRRVVGSFITSGMGSTQSDSSKTGTSSSTPKNRRLLFISAMKSFELRVLYANVRNDLMVNFGTAALEPGVCAVSGNEMERVIRDASKTHCAIDRSHDEKGCKVCFQYWIDDERNEQQLGDVSDNRSHTRPHELTVFGRRRRRRRGLDEEDEEDEEFERIREVVMAQRLRSIGWWVVGVDFPVALPIAHNRIVAMSRNFIHAWINAPGQRAVHHLVDFVCARFKEHAPLFKRTNDEGEVVHSDRDDGRDCALGSG